MNIYTPLNHEEKKLYNYIQKNGPITKRALQNYFNYYSAPTLNRFITSIVEKGLIYECGQDVSNGGRKPSLFDICETANYIVGIDFSRGNIQIVITTLKMKIIDKLVIGVGPQFVGTGLPFSDKYTSKVIYESSPHKAVELTICDLRDMLAANNIKQDQLLGIGISAVGPLDTNTGIIGKVSYFYDSKAWCGFDIKTPFEEAFKVPVFVDCGSYLAALSEYLYGPHRGTSSLSFFSCGIGLRLGQIVSDKLIRTSNNDEGSIEHMIINQYGERCRCGKRGCVWTYSSTFTISENVRKRIASGESCSITKEIPRIYYADVVSASENGDSLCTYEVQEAAKYFGIALANYVTIMNPKVIVLGGKLASISNVFFKEAVETAKANLTIQPEDHPTFIQGGSFGRFTMPVGAAALVFEKSIGNTDLL